MELADPRTVAALISNSEPIRRPSAAVKAGTQQRRRRLCTCGVCPTCLDNAKWERIYKEKFEDAGYYTHLPGRCGSSLAWLRPLR